MDYEGEDHKNGILGKCMAAGQNP